MVRVRAEARLHEFVDQRVVLLPLQAGVTDPHVVRVLEQLLVVSAKVEGDGEHAMRRDATVGAVERQLTYGDARGDN